ncbi:MAG: DUF4328 domain-containing protein [Phycisphaeraceae bacterium]
MSRDIYAGQYRSPAALAAWTNWSSLALVLTYAVSWTCLILPAVIQFSEPMRNIFVTVDEQSRNLMLVAMAISCASYLWWCRRCIKNLHAFGVQGVKTSPRGAWLWQLAPIANFVMGFRIMKKILLGSRLGVSAIDTTKEPNPRGLGIWWALLLLCVVTISTDYKEDSSGKLVLEGVGLKIFFGNLKSPMQMIVHAMSIVIFMHYIRVATADQINKARHQ